MASDASVNSFTKILNMTRLQDSERFFQSANLCINISDIFLSHHMTVTVCGLSRTRFLDVVSLGTVVQTVQVAVITVAHQKISTFFRQHFLCPIRVNGFSYQPWI